MILFSHLKGWITINKYIQKLIHELHQYEAKCEHESNISILDILWYCYAASNPIDDGRTHAAEAALSPVLQELSFENNNILIDQITAYQRAAFWEGILLGTHLTEELA